MHDALLVRCAQRLCELGADSQHQWQGQGADAPQSARQVLALEQLHHQIGRAVRKLAKLRDLNQGRMLDQVRRPRLVDEALPHLRVVRVFLAQQLDRDSTGNLLVYRFVDHTHAAMAELPDDAIGPQSLWQRRRLDRHDLSS